MKTTKKAPSMLRAALAYAKLGWAVFPVYKKIPLKDGHGFKDATKDTETLTKWFKGKDHLGIGVATGSASGFWALDVDSSDGKVGGETLRSLERVHGMLPATVTALTGGGGQHYLFRVDGDTPWPGINAGKIGADLDHRGNGGYIVVAPSLHKSGRRYMWEITSRPGEVPIALSPQWLLDLIAKNGDGTTIQQSATPITPVIEGKRNHLLASAAGTMRRRGFSQKAIEAALLVDNQEVCRPPLSESEVRAIAKSVARYQPATPTIVDQVKPPDHSLKIGDEVEIAQALIGRLREESPALVHDQSAIYRYSDKAGIWDEMYPDTLSRMVHSYSGTIVCRGINKDGSPKLEKLLISANKTAGVLTVASNELNQRDFFRAERPGVAFANGFASVSAKGVTLEPHSKDNRARFSLPFDYVSQATGPRWSRYWSEVFLGDPDAAEKEQSIREFIGLCLIGQATKYQKAIIFLGEGAANGKSQAITVLRALFPERARSAIEPHSFEKGEYVAALGGVRLNSTTELPESDLLETRMLKAVVTGDPITARPLYKNPYTFNPIAGHLFCANALPSTSDMTDGFWRRFIIIEFNRKFEGAGVERGLGDRITSDPMEMQGVAAWAMAGAVSALQRDGLLVPSSSVAAMESWREHADQIVQFLQDCAIWPAEESPGFLDLDEIFERYKTWADATRHKSLTKITLARRLNLLKLVQRKRIEGKPHPQRLYRVKWAN